MITGQSVPAGYEQYAEFKPSVTVKNNGIVATNGFLGVAWYLSTDNVLDGFDYNVGYGSSGEPLAPGASVEISPDLVTIIYQGSNYLIAKVDHSGYIAETDESNNTWVTPNFVVNPTHVDFTFTQFSVPAISYPIGGMIKPGYQLKNIGSTDAGGNVFVRFLLSKDAVRDENDIDLTTSQWIHQLTGRPEEFSSSEYLALAVPQVAPGDYFLLAVADANEGYGNQSFNETDETNNVSAQPIRIVASDFDIEVTNFITTQYDPVSGLLSGEVGLRNNGTTGVTGYTVSAQLVKEGEAISYVFQEHREENVIGKYIAPGEQVWLRVQVVIDPAPEPGTYYAAVGVNLSMNSYIPEAERQNNALMDDTRPVYIDAQPRPHVKLKEVSVPGPVDEEDQSIRVAVTMMNTGYITSFDNRYNIAVFDAQGNQIHGETVLDKVDFQPGETVTREVSITPYQPLPAGVYKIVLTCFDPCDTDAEPVTGYFPVVAMTYRLSGMVQGEDGTPINKGKLLLYRKESNGQIRFTQKADPFQGPTFSFNIDTDPYTLYFIPDPVQYPGYAPTIYGKTVTLESSNFFTTTQDKDVVMEVLKLQPLAAGAGVISGRLASVDDLRCYKVQVGISLAMRMRYHINRHAVHAQGDVCAMVGVETPKKDLLGFSTACVLGGDYARYHTEDVLRRFERPQSNIDLTDRGHGLLRTSRTGDGYLFQPEARWGKLDGYHLCFIP